MVDVWTATADKSLNSAVTFTEWNNLVGANGNLDYLYNRGWRLHGVDSTERTTVSTSAVDLSTVTGLSIPVAQPVLIIGSYRKTSGAAVATSLGLKINSTVVVDASVPLITDSATNQAEDGTFYILMSSRSANYRNGIVGMYQTRISANGQVALATVQLPAGGAFTNIIPNATITDVIIRGITGSASVTCAVKDIQVYAGGVTL